LEDKQVGVDIESVRTKLIKERHVSAALMVYRYGKNGTAQGKIGCQTNTVTLIDIQGYWPYCDLNVLGARTAVDQPLPMPTLVVTN
jgi:hypothetical protein